MATFWSLFGIIGGSILLIYLLIKLPEIIRDFKKYYSVKKQLELEKFRNTVWMAFLHDSAKKQRETIEDVEVKLCWDLFIQCIETIQSGFGNGGQCITKKDIKRLIETASSNNIEDSATIGEDTFRTELIAYDRLEIILVGNREQCSASLMLKELEILKRNIQDFKN